MPGERPIGMKGCTSPREPTTMMRIDLDGRFRGAEWATLPLAWSPTAATRRRRWDWRRRGNGAAGRMHRRDLPVRVALQT